MKIELEQRGLGNFLAIKGISHKAVSYFILPKSTQEGLKLVLQLQALVYDLAKLYGKKYMDEQQNKNSV